MNHLVQFGTSERESFGSVRDFRPQSNHLVQFGTSERMPAVIFPSERERLLNKLSAACSAQNAHLVIC